MKLDAFFISTKNIMKYLLFPVGVISLFITVSTDAFAVDRDGDFTTRDFFPAKDEYALSTWKVITPHLNCRSRPGKTHKILHVFHQGTALTTQISEGSHDNVGFLQMDAEGKPWMKVFINYSSALRTCFVRANRAYIVPVLGKH